MLGGMENVPVRRRIGLEAGETGWWQLPLVITLALSFAASDGLETAWRSLIGELAG
jgi:hypothetical protein